MKCCMETVISKNRPAKWKEMNMNEIIKDIYKCRFCGKRITAENPKTFKRFIKKHNLLYKLIRN